MIEKIRKRDGRIVSFDAAKITNAIFKAAQAVGGENYALAEQLCTQVVQLCEAQLYEGEIPNVEDIQDLVEKVLIENGHARTAKAFILYRDKRSRIREAKSELMDIVSEILVETNKDSGEFTGSSPSSKMLQIAKAASQKYYLSNLLPDELAAAHRRGDIHIHYLDYYGKTLNTFQVSLERFFKNGVVSGTGAFPPPRSLQSAMTLIITLLQRLRQDIFGSIVVPYFDKEMGALLRTLSVPYAYAEVLESVHTLISALNTMSDGTEPLPLTLCVGTDTSAEGRMVARAVLEAVKRGSRGIVLRPNIVFRLKKGCNLEPGSPNYDIFQLAAEAASLCMNPTFCFSDTQPNQGLEDETAYSGCRIRTMGVKAAGHGNIALVTINLPRIALQARKIETFFVHLERLLQVAMRQLLHRFEIVSELKVRDLPFVMGHQLYLGSEMLSWNDPVRDAIRHGSLAIGFVGLAEVLNVLVGQHHGLSNEARDLGLEIVKTMHNRCGEFSRYYGLQVGLYATPTGLCSRRFLLLDRAEFGEIANVTAQAQYTDSFHVPDSDEPTTEARLQIEAPYHALCDAGHMSYAGLPNNSNQLNNMACLLRFMHDLQIGYVGFKFPLHCCLSCGFVHAVNQLCPRCGSRLGQVKRRSGYLSIYRR